MKSLNLDKTRLSFLKFLLEERQKPLVLNGVEIFELDLGKIYGVIVFSKEGNLVSQSIEQLVLSSLTGANLFSPENITIDYNKAIAILREFAPDTVITDVITGKSWRWAQAFFKGGYKTTSDIATVFEEISQGKDVRIRGVADRTVQLLYEAILGLKQ